MKTIIQAKVIIVFILGSRAQYDVGKFDNYDSGSFNIKSPNYSYKSGNESILAEMKRLIWCYLLGLFLLKKCKFNKCKDILGKKIFMYINNLLFEYLQNHYLKQFIETICWEESYLWVFKSRPLT